MNFCFVFPRFKLLSGAERLILRLADALGEMGHNVTLLSHQFDDSCKPLLPAKANLVVTQERLDFSSNRYINAAFDYWKTAKLADLIPAGNIDAVCCFGPALAAVPKIGRLGKAPILYFCYEPPRFLYTDAEVIRNRMGWIGLFARPAFGFYRRKDAALVRSVDAVLSNSYFGKEQIKRVYDRDAKVITHGLDPYRAGTRRHALREQWGIKPEDCAVITVNYLHPRKRIDLFLETIKTARKENASIHGIVVGDGPERQRLESMPAPGIHFTGFVPEQDLYEYYQSADLYLHTARLETFGLSVIEAAGNGLPVVSVNEGGPAETVMNGETGFLCEADAAALSAAILKLVSVQDRREKGKKAFESVRSKYSWEQGARDFLNALQTTKP